MQFAFGCAAGIYRRKAHPRLFLSPRDVPPLRRTIRTGKARKLMAALRAKVRPLVEAVRDCDDPASMLTHHTTRTHPRGGAVLEGLADIAMVGLLDEDRDAVEAIRRCLAAIPAAELRGPRDTYSLGYASWGNVQTAYDLTWPKLTPAQRKSFARWAADISVRQTLKVLSEGHYLRHAAMNIPIAGMMSAMFSLLAVDGEPGAGSLEKERAELLRYFEATMLSVVGPNGYPWEDIGYGSGMVSLLSRVVEAVRRAGLYDAYRQCPPYKRFGQAMLHFVQPWGKILSNTGDYGADFGWTSMVFPRLATETNDPTLLWLQGTLSYPLACAGAADMSTRRRDFPEVRLAKGVKVPVDVWSVLTVGDLARPLHPSRAGVATQFLDAGRGIVTFRSGWDDEATFVVFDGGQRSSSVQGHDHASGGHFSLSALGEYFAIDTGRYNMEQDQHNVVIVNGKSGQSTDGEWRGSYHRARLTGYCPGRFVDTASVDSSQASNCYWALRTLGLAKDPARTGMPAYVWIAEDVNFRNAYDAFWWQLQTDPENRFRLGRDHAVIVGHRRGNRLGVHFVLPNPWDYPRPHRLKLSQDTQLCGSYNYIENPRKQARDYARLVGNPAFGPVFARPRLVAKVRGFNGRFLALLVPQRKGRPAARVQALPAMDNSLAARITFGGVEDTLIWSYDHGLLEAAGVVARGQWAVVRRRRRTGEVLDAAVGGGVGLKVDGAELPLEK